MTDEHGATDSDTKTHTQMHTLKDCEETQTYNTDPNDADSDGDGLGDGSELSEWNQVATGAWDTRYNRSAPTGTTNNLLLWDADGDGIRDGLEFDQPSSIFGSCSDIDGRNECPDPRTRDIYMHVNWMVDPGESCFGFFTCGDHDHQPSDGEVQRIYDNFADHNSVSSRLDSVNVHIYLDEGTRHADEVSFGDSNNVSDGDNNNDFYDWKPDFFPSERKGTFHLALFAHEDPDGAGGTGEYYGDDFIIYDAVQDSSDELEETWMHELGHNGLAVYHSECSSHAGHDHGFFANQDATHLDHDNPGNPSAFYDEYDAANNDCVAQDGVQDVFDHSSGPGAMSYTSDDTTYIDATWDDLKLWKMNLADRKGVDGDRMVDTEEGPTWISAPASGPLG